MEIPARERYLYLTILPFIIIALILLVVKNIPLNSSICEPGKSRILSKSNGEEKNSFMIREAINLSVESEYKIKDFKWSLDDNIYINNSGTVYKNVISVYFTDRITATTIKVELNNRCTIKKEIEIYNK